MLCQGEAYYFSLNECNSDVSLPRFLLAHVDLTDKASEHLPGVGMLCWNNVLFQVQHFAVYCIDKRGSLNYWWLLDCGVGIRVRCFFISILIFRSLLFFPHASPQLFSFFVNCHKQVWKKNYVMLKVILNTFWAWSDVNETKTADYFWSLFFLPVAEFW